MEPYFEVCGEHVAVREAAFQPEAWREPWFFLSVSREAETVKVNPDLMQRAMEAANRRGCSRIIVNASKKSGLLTGAPQSAQVVDDHASPPLRTAHHPRTSWRMRPAGGCMSEATPTGFFTLGVSPERYELPHPRLGLPVILLVRRVLCRAFAILREEEFGLAEADEDDVTAALRAVIENNLRQTGSIPGFNRHSYESVVRQGQAANFDGTRLTKSPDLCFKLRHDDREPRMALSEFDALFVECKPVDATHSAGHDYCDDGLIRFVRGDYAWAMQEGMMLAYVRDGRTIAGHLIPAMQ